MATSGGIIRTVGSHQGLRRDRFPGRGRAQPHGRRRRDLRPARAQRRRQDHDRRDAHHPGHPDLGTAFVGGIDVVAHPALAKQLIGIVSQQNTLDRQLTVWENLYFHGRLFGMGAQGVPPDGRRAAGAVPALQVGQGLGLRPVRAAWPSGSWWPGPSSTARPCSSWTSRRPASTPRAGSPCGTSCGELNGDGQTILLTTHYMEEADQLCDRVAIMDHGRILALDTPAAAQAGGRRRHHRDRQGGRRPRPALADALRSRARRA